MIEIEHLTKRYGEHLAVDDLSFQVDSGQIYGFPGPNGEGKSTTMNIMTGPISFPKCRLSAASGAVLLEMSVKKANLEEVFIELTEADSDETAEAAESEVGDE